jgi:hypothetical protein
MNTDTISAHKKDVIFTVNVLEKKDLSKLEKLGSEIAQHEGLKFDGYTLNTVTPYSIDKAKPTLLFS